jgi:NADPH-dependent 2,4-dienoyl-CoA reductase/sulfur reductase-like enzyme
MPLPPDPTRRRVLRGAALGAALTIGGCGSVALTGAKPRVVVVGGGYGGATAARHLAQGAVDVTLVEREARFVSCPMSNLVIGGSLGMGDITLGYERLPAHGVRLVQDVATSVDAERRIVTLASGTTLPYDRLVLSPGIDFLLGRVEGLDDVAARTRFLHAYRAGPQTLALRAQVEGLRDGGVFAISIPRAPLRCPPAPYERACQVAWYVKRMRGRCKVLVLDGNEDVQAEKALFTRAWAELYPDIVEYRPNCVLTGVDARSGVARFETAEDERPDVLNVIPPHGAGAIAHAAGVVTANGQWCEVDFRTFESIRVPRVHVLGDAIQVAPAMPKSGHMANQHGHVAAAAILDALLDRPARDPADLAGSCYSYVTDRDAGHIASRHRYDAAQGTYLPEESAGSVSTIASAADGDAAKAWAHRIWADMLG